MESGNEGEVIDLSRSETAYISLELPSRSTTNITSMDKLSKNLHFFVYLETCSIQVITQKIYK